MSERDPGSTGKDRLLWVEAETPERAWKARALEGFCQVDFALPGEPALAAVRKHRPDAPDAVIVRVEDEGCLALLRALEEHPHTRAIPVILLGGPESEDLCLAGMEAGACDFLAEPFRPRTLALRVAACLRWVRARRESLLRERDLLAEAQMAAEALGRSEERFQTFLRHSPVASWMTDEEARIVFLSEPYTRIFGIRNEDAVGRSVFEIYPAAFAQTFYDNVRAVAETGGSLQTVEPALRPDGSVGYFLVHKFPVRDEAGRLLVGGVAADITEMKHNEEALRESEERFRLATEAISGMIYDWSIETDAVQRSLGLQGLLGYWPEEAPAHVGWWREQVHPEDVPLVARDIYGAIEKGSASFSVEYRVRHRDGSYVHAWDKGLIVRDAEGRATRVVGSTIDISGRKRAQEELERAHQEAQAANEAKDQFLATLSHELRTPLTPVLAVISSLELDPRLAGHAGEMAMIRRNVELEARLIDDLLDLTRITRGKLELHRRETDARQVVEHALATIGRDVAERGIDLAAELTAEEHRLWADAPRLTQVFWNLLSNAVKFTPPGGRITVRSWTEAAGQIRFGAGELVVEVRDTGIGIEPGALPRIFDAFEQAGRRITRKFGGLGLGLAVSRAIVDLHGGRITAASEGQGRGAAFTVRLPLGGIQEDLDETGAWFPRIRSSAGAVGSPGAFGGTGAAGGEAGHALSILLVEDHPDTAEAMADLLRLSGHQVTVAGTVAAGLAAAEAGAFDLLLSDLGLPDGSGQDLMRELGRRYHLKGIALSGYGMEEDVRRSREAGFARHLTKPVNRQALETTIRQVVQGN